MSSPFHPVRRIVVEIVVLCCAVGLLWLAWQADARWFDRHVVQFSFVVSPISQWFCRFGRVLALLLALFLLLFVRPRAGRYMATQPLAAVLGQFLGIGLAVLLALVFSEGALRFFANRNEARRRATQPAGRLSWSPICEADARYGYVFIASQQSLQIVGGREVPLAINAEHNRAATINNLPDPQRPTILFVGESITVGSGLYYEETFPVRVARRLGVQEVNLGALGYGSDQAYLRLIDALPAYKRPIAVVTLFLPGMLSRNFQSWRAHLDFDPQGALIVRQPWKPFELSRLFHEKFPFWTDATIDRSLALTRAVFVDTVKQAQARGAVSLFVVPVYGPQIPVEQRADSWILRELFERDHLPYLLVHLDDHSSIPGDGHPNPHGAQQLADAVTAALGARLGSPDVSRSISAPPDGDPQSALAR